MVNRFTFKFGIKQIKGGIYSDLSVSSFQSADEETSLSFASVLDCEL